MKGAYYNEIDPNAAQWLRNLIAAGLIAPGDVDERSIEDVCPTDLLGYAQCHFFAGIGVWSYALRRAGWPDDRSVWTGSCPCQPFSSAGEGKGFADERHLWPSFFHLIEQRRPPVVLGEQVASKDADPWIDLVQDDMEALDYAFGAVPFPSASIGAPHIRDRLYWVADSGNGQRDGVAVVRGSKRDGENAGRTQGGGQPEPRSNARRLADNDDVRLEQATGAGLRANTEHDIEPCGGAGGLGNADNARSRRNPGAIPCPEGSSRREVRSEPDCLESAGEVGGVAHSNLSISEQLAGQRTRSGETPSTGTHHQPDGRGELAQGEPADGPTNGLWRAADWLLCRDGKWRPVEPGTFPLAHGAPARVGRLRAYGNAINAEQARIFIETVMESRGMEPMFRAPYGSIIETRGKESP